MWYSCPMTDLVLPADRPLYLSQNPGAVLAVI